MPTRLYRPSCTCTLYCKNACMHAPTHIDPMHAHTRVSQYLGISNLLCICIITNQQHLNRLYTNRHKSPKHTRSTHRQDSPDFIHRPGDAVAGCSKRESSCCRWRALHSSAVRRCDRCSERKGKHGRRINDEDHEPSSTGSVANQIGAVSARD